MLKLLQVGNEEGAFDAQVGNKNEQTSILLTRFT